MNCLNVLLQNFSDYRQQVENLYLQKLFEKPCRFNELKNLIPGISAKVLSESLKQLEADGIICKKILAENPPQKVEYFLSELGEKRRPLIFEIEKFGIFYNEHK